MELKERRANEFDGMAKNLMPLGVKLQLKASEAVHTDDPKKWFEVLASLEEFIETMDVGKKRLIAVFEDDWKLEVIEPKPARLAKMEQVCINAIAYYELCKNGTVAATSFPLTIKDLAYLKSLAEAALQEGVVE